MTDGTPDRMLGIVVDDAVDQDGNLPAALTVFREAISGLIDTRYRLAGRRDCNDCHNQGCDTDCNKHPCAGHPTPTPPLYMQLFDAVEAGRTGPAQSGGGGAGSPIWTAAHDTLAEIDTGVAVWQPGYKGVPATMARLRQQAAHGWRPQDVKQLDQKTNILNAWRGDIMELFEPPRRWHLPSPCPACNTATVYRKDEVGASVRQPALQLTVDGCQCLSCRYVWEPYRYRILAESLGYPLPEGVLE